MSDHDSQCLPQGRCTCLDWHPPLAVVPERSGAES